MNSIENVSRRTVLKGMAGTGGLVLGLKLAPFARNFAAAQGTAFAPSVFVSIDKSGAVTIVCHRSEMGQGIRTSLPMVVADEMEADWSRVVVEQAVGDAKYGDQYTDGSLSIRTNFHRMREFGATARHILEQAAAKQLGVDASECTARNHTVVHKPTGEVLGFGDLVDTAAGLPVPPIEEVGLKDPKDFRYIGTDMTIVDMDDITHGTATFGIDVELPGMKFASVERSPVHLGKAKSYDASATLNVPGVEAVVEIPAVEEPVGFKALGGIAVVANNTWSAMEGRKKLKIDWDFGPNASYDSVAYRRSLEETARRPGSIAREMGDVNQAFASADQVLEREYYVPHLAHATMEPPSGTASVANGKCEVWASCQDAQALRSTVAEAIGFDEADVTARVPLLGGAFGRKSKPDFAAEAAICSKEVGAPVKVTWTREDDVRQSYYHSVAAQYVKAGLDKNGKVTGWLHRTAFPSIMTIFEKDINLPADWELDFGLVDLPFDIPNMCLERCEAHAHVRIGWLRSVCNIYHAFAIHSMVDELAHAAGRDPVEFKLELIGAPRVIDLPALGLKHEYSNYLSPIESHPIETGRLSNVLEIAAENIGWGRSLPGRSGLGIAAHRSFTTYVATAVEVAVSKAGQISIPRLEVAIDCGTHVNPDRVRAQVEGGTLYGMSATCYNEITAREGHILQSNFHNYPVVRMGDAPGVINVHIVKSDAPPGGVGEPPTPPFAPALCNAIYAATGKRIRSLPIASHDLSEA